MNFVAALLGGEGKRYSLSQPSWTMPPKCRDALKETRLGRTCYANGSIHHELLGEPCTLVVSSETGDLKCDEIWLSAVAAEWQIKSQGVWLCGQGHTPMSITEESCTTKGCSINKHDLPEVAANLWFAVASREEEVLACESTSFNTSKAAKIFARVFSNGCGV